jgi:hypothetical protein
MQAGRLLDDDREQQHQQEENIGKGHDQALGMGDLHELLERRGLGNAAMTLQLLANVLQAQGSSRLSSPLVPLLRLLPRRFCGPATSAASNGL